MRIPIIVMVTVALCAPLASCRAAGLDARWGPAGQLESLHSAGRLLIGKGEVVLAGPEWKAQAAQSQATGVQRSEEGGDSIWRGTLARDEIAAAFTQRVRQEGDRIRIEVTLEPQRAFGVAAVLWRGSVPVADAAGGKWVVVGDGEVQSGPLPKDAAKPYVLAGSGSALWAGWVGERAGLRIAGIDGTLPRVQVQDDRQFGMPQYEFQVYTPAAGRLEPGKPVRLAFTLEAVGPEVLAAEEERMRRNQVPFAAAGPLAIRGVTADRNEVSRFERIELRLDLSATYDNPFDPEQIDVVGRFSAPSGASAEVPGFLYRPYARTRDGKGERLRPAGPPEWRVRFSPTETGEYSCIVSARDRSGTTQSKPVRFRAVAGKRPGFVRVSKESNRYFAFDSGAPYFAIGANVCWAGAGGTFDYDDWFPRYGESGCNYARLWIGPFDLFTLERKALPAREDTGLGRCDQASAWRLDYVLDLAERHGIYLMYCIDSFNSLRVNPPYATWAANPYSAANGGMLEKPEEFFTNEAARKAFRNRLRYLVARWGYSPHVLSWEFWNEVDIIQKYVGDDVKRWHQEMSRSLRAMDPWRHLQTTSYARSDGDPAVDGIPEMDYVQTHNYGSPDMGADLPRWSRQKLAAFAKPHYIGEFGLSAGGAEGTQDPQGVSLHNGLWAPVLSGDAGTGMLWWWDSYIHPLNLYGNFAALSAFVKGVDWPRERFRPAEGAEVAFATRPAQPDLRDLLLHPSAASWNPSPANQPNTFVLPRSGRVEGLDRLSKVMHGVRNHPQLHNPATFAVDYARAGRFVVHVHGVSGHGGAALKVTLDGQTVLDKQFPDPDGAEKTDTLTQYNAAYPVDVPAGKHTLVVENTGADWLYVVYSVPAYVESWEPRLRVLALAGEQTTLAWVQHTDHTWSRLADGVKPAPASGTVLRLSGVRAGRYRVETWDTYRGVVAGTHTCQATAGALSVPLPEIGTDVALKITPAR